MHALRQTLVIILSLLLFGALKLHYEDNLSETMVEQRLLQPKLSSETRLEVGQISAAAMLGGMRSLIASIWNLRAYYHFENLDWLELEKNYELITTLQPHTTSYWTTGAWHLHTNASTYYTENEELSPIRQRSMRRLYINKGSDFLEEGVRQNPDDWKLHLALAELWSNPYREPDIPRAIKHYENVLKSEHIPDYARPTRERFYFYILTRSPEHSQQAYKLGKELYYKSKAHHRPNFSCCLFALQNKLQITADERINDSDLFPSNQLKRKWLNDYWRNQNKGYPMNGVKSSLTL